MASFTTDLGMLPLLRDVLFGGILMAGVGLIIYRFKIIFMQSYQTRVFKAQKSYRKI